MSREIPSLAQALISRRLDARNQASLAVSSREWKSFAQPNLSAKKKALLKIADVRRRRMIELFVDLFTDAMEKYIPRLSAVHHQAENAGGLVSDEQYLAAIPRFQKALLSRPQRRGMVQPETWFALAWRGMRLLLPRPDAADRFPNGLILEVPRQGFAVRVSATNEALSIRFAHGTDRAGARMYGAALVAAFPDIAQVVSYVEESDPMDHLGAKRYRFHVQSPAPRPRRGLGAAMFA